MFIIRGGDGEFLTYKEAYRADAVVYSEIEKRTKRKPYVRSAYFSKQKIFFDYFWLHLRQKPFAERARRLKFFAEFLEGNRTFT